jgi:nucleoside-diphosphate-sugar epimerase
MKLFVTGATGFVGRNLLKTLVARGHDVFCLVRSDVAAHKVLASGGNPVFFEDSSPESLASQLAGVEITIHVAAFLGFWGAFEEIKKANVDLSLFVMRASEIAGVQRMIHISAASVVMRDEIGMTNVNEMSSYIERQDFAYSFTKALAEIELKNQVSGLKLIILRPPLIWGHGDVFDEKIIPEVKRGRFALFDRGNFHYSVCHVENLIHAILIAFESGVHKQEYFISDAEVTSAYEFMSTRLLAGGVNVPSISISTKLGSKLADLVEVVWKLFSIKSEAPLTKEMVRLMGYEFLLDITKARNELGYSPILSRDVAMKSLRSN